MSISPGQTTANNCTMASAYMSLRVLAMTTTLSWCFYRSNSGCIPNDNNEFTMLIYTFGIDNFNDNMMMNCTLLLKKNTTLNENSHRKYYRKNSVLLDNRILRKVWIVNGSRNQFDEILTRYKYTILIVTLFKIISNVTLATCKYN